MIRNLKALGIAMAAVFAFGAMSAASASAQEGSIEGLGAEHFTLLGAEDPKGTNAFTAFGQAPVECPDSEYTGHKADITPHEDLTDGATEVTITPHYKGCESGEDPRTVHMGDCDYTFYDFTTTPVENDDGTYGFTVDLHCDESPGVLITGGTCTVTVPEQTELTGLHATNEPNETIRIHGTVHGITASACGGFLHTSEAELHQDIVVGDTEGAGVTIVD